MPARLREGSSLKREIAVTGIGPVNVEITSSGLEFWVKGHRKRVRLSWLQAVKAGDTPLDVPSYLAGNPVEMLQHYGAASTE